MLTTIVLISLKWFLLCCVSCLTLWSSKEIMEFMGLKRMYPKDIHNLLVQCSIITGVTTGLICVVSSLLLLISWIP